MIQIINAKKYYNKGKQNQVIAIDNTSLTFPDSGLVAILGSSGCGKTTLLNMIGGLDKPDNGKIFINGQKMNGLSSSKIDDVRNKYIGYVFQNYRLIDDMTVFDNVALPLKMLGVKDKKKITESVYYALEMVGLYRYRNRPASALSGGERQRVGIARAIVKNPSIVIADEPTGNLDSGNTIEVMNIIKNISKDKLVILVTHEKKLAEFFADRIVKIVDGRVSDDYENDHNETLDYRMDNKFYLKDFETHKSYTSNGINLSVYSDSLENANITVVIKNDNIYINSDNHNTEVVDDNSPIEFVDDHYKSISKEDAEKNKFDFDKFDYKQKKIKYHSVFNIFNIFKAGIVKVRSYPVIKKILLLGFIISSMFVMYSVGNILGVNEITDDEFTKYNRDYLLIESKGISAEVYKEAKELEGVKYVLPGDSIFSFNISYSNLYYQSQGASDSFSGSLSAISTIDKEQIIAGRNIENSNEIIVDRLLVDNIFKNGNAVMLGINSYEKFLGLNCILSSSNSNMQYTIVGVVNTLSPVIYVNDNEIIDIAINGTSAFYYDKENNAQLTSITEAKGILKLVKGRMPGDFEVILPEAMKSSVKLNSQLDDKIAGQKLTVVGFYKSSSEEDVASFTTKDTLEYKLAYGSYGLMIYPNNKEAVISYYKAKNVNIIDTYEDAKKEYTKDINEQFSSTIITAIVVLAISLIEIFLMLRSSFLSRIKEVGTFRAIGLKKSDIYKMFLGEILAITTFTAPIGFIIMGKVLSTLSKISLFAMQYVFNSSVVIISVIIVYGFNILVGLLPVFTTLRKTPARILSRVDVD